MVKNKTSITADTGISLRETAEILNVSRATAKREFDNGNIPHVKVGRQYRTTRQNVFDFLNGVYYNPDKMIDSRLNSDMKGDAA